MKLIKNQKGMTLVETIIALLLLFLLVTAFSGALVTGLYSEVEVDHSLKAGDLAAGIIEHLGENRELLSDNENTTSLDSLFFDLNYAVENELIFDSLEKENSYITIDKVANNGELFKISIELKWQEPNRERSYNLVTYLAGEL